VLTLLTPSYDGLLLKLRGSVAIVLAPFSNNFWRYFEITIYSRIILYFFLFTFKVTIGIQ